MNLLLVIFLILAVQSDEYISTKKCTCIQLLSESDCIKKYPNNCEWNSLKEQCQNFSFTNPQLFYESYCDQFNEQNCAKTDGCAWVDGKCTFFTGCTPYQNRTHEECQSISILCIGDGQNCLQLDECQNYGNKNSCSKNLRQKHCYWNDKYRQCSEAKTCDQLPTKLESDAACRASISTCTANIYGGCIESGINCDDQKSQVSCVWNYSKSQKCYWNTDDNKCVDRTCQNAATSLLTDESCKDIDITCTTKKNGGCITRTTCQEANTQNACITNSQGELCFWNDNTCVDKICDNAPSNIDSNAACQKYLPICITNGHGCVENSSCNAAVIEVACVKNLAGNLCVWNGSCKDKTCSNAPLQQFTHELCANYLDKCTVNSQRDGCVDKTCENAPIIYQSNLECEQYFPFNNCVAKNGGGCMQNSSCSVLSQISCDKDIYGNECFWDNYSCKDKTCLNAPQILTTHAECQSYSNKCTVNKINSGCIDSKCENLLTQDICVQDDQQQKCIFKSKCYKKECAFASQLYTTHLECNNYLSSCTLNNIGYGCMQIPLTCQAITIEQACVYKRGLNNLVPCGWDGELCVDYSCNTLSKSFTTTNQCNFIIPGCVSANPIDGIVVGCMKLPQNCSERLTFDNCQVEGQTKCLWSSQINSCVEITCQAATLFQSPEIINQSNCNTFLTGCMVSNDGTSCIAKLTACSGYTSANNCIDGAKSTGGDCYWNSGTCVDKVCTNITLNTHGGCYGILNTCTVNATKTSCMSLAACNTYTQEYQCFQNSHNKACIWTGIVCRDRICTDAPRTLSYDSVSECEGFTVSSGTCTVISNVFNYGGCMTKQLQCSGYSESNCFEDIQGNQCIWHNNKCWQESKFTCANIDGVTFTTPICENVLQKCKGNETLTACIPKVCSDYTNREGLLSGTTQLITDADCSSLDSTCTIDYTGSNYACQIKQQSCSSYYTANTCTFSTSGQCQFVGSMCVLKSANICETITNIPTFNTANCESVLYSCKVNQENNGCETKTCSDYTTQDGLMNGVPVSTHEHCQALDSSCTIDLTLTAVSCQTFQTICPLYTTSQNCTVAKEGACYFNDFNNYNCEMKICNQNSLTTFDTTNCETLSPTCKVNADLSACELKTCADYTTQDGLINGIPVSTDAHCLKFSQRCTIDLTLGAVKCQAKQGLCNQYLTLGRCTIAYEGNCVWNPNIGESGACQTYSNRNCNWINGFNLTDTYCANYDSVCIVNRDGTSCQVKQSTCSAYTSLANCTRTSSGVECIGTSDINGTCIPVTPSTACTSIHLGIGLYTHELCNLKNSNCTNNSTIGCIAKTCANAILETSFVACNTWLSTCTWNGTIGCVNISATCASQLSTACYQAIEGDCHIIGSSCVKKTCDNAPLNYMNHAVCQYYLSSCTIAGIGGCIPRQSCSAYTTQSQCQSKNSSGGSCYWSQMQHACLDLICANIDQTSNFNTHSSCNEILNICTVRASTFGCQSLGPCSSYAIQEQCKMNGAGELCEWNTNYNTSFCVDKSCSSAPYTLNSHAACSTYFGNNQCTVAVLNNIDGINTLGGCIPLGQCSTYIDAEQCKINELGNPCVWKDDICSDFSCFTASSTINTHYDCQAYASNCTVNQNGSGCMDLLTICESYLIEQNCIINTKGSLCYWNTITNSCITRTCENAPEYVSTTEECDTYLYGCTLDFIKCKTKICEDYQLTTDAQCRLQLSNCTTDGTKCVQRGTCFQALGEAGCITDLNGKQCQWIQASEKTEAYCAYRTCLTAPIDSYKTEQECASYFINCTTKNGGGCVTKSNCSAANIQAACSSALDGTLCQWDTTKNICRDKDCQDYIGITHSACQLINSSCTAGQDGYCTKVQSCLNTTVRAACIYGLDGPCLWVEGIVNLDGSIGACYPYTSCQSLAWNTDSQCKLISPNCTTDGTNCVPITQCAKTNLNGGCVTGSDGTCMEVTLSDQINKSECKKFTSCNDAKFTTHQKCQEANIQCTTNNNYCIPLAKTCSEYYQYGCYKNSIGQVTKNGLITSTGMCSWDDKQNICKDQTCNDLSGTNHSVCNSKLSSCTSNGNSCISISKCSTYEQSACGIAQGSEGVCLWETDKSLCRAWDCSDIKNGKTTELCQFNSSNCISNGKICIAKSICSSYTTQTACNSGGTDGICVFTASTSNKNGTCALMASCQQASNDKNACLSAMSRCAWTALGKEIGKCELYTCESYYRNNNICSNILGWDKTQQKVCILKNYLCVEISPNDLQQDSCYQTSNYSYTWSTKYSKCVSCSSTQTDTNKIINETQYQLNLMGSFLILWLLGM